MAKVSEENKARMKADGSWTAFVKYKAYAKVNGLPRPKPGSWGPEDAERFGKELTPDSVQAPGQQATNKNTGKAGSQEDTVVINTIAGGPKYVESGKARSNASSMQAIAWVAENMSKSLVPTAPSAEAYNMLVWVKSSAVAKREYWLRMYPKLIPDKVDEKTSVSVKDDSGYQLCKIEEQMAKLAATDIVFPEGSA